MSYFLIILLLSFYSWFNTFCCDNRFNTLTLNYKDFYFFLVEPENIFKLEKEDIVYAVKIRIYIF